MDQDDKDIEGQEEIGADEMEQQEEEGEMEDTG